MMHKLGKMFVDFLVHKTQRFPEFSKLGYNPYFNLAMCPKGRRPKDAFERKSLEKPKKRRIRLQFKKASSLISYTDLLYVPVVTESTKKLNKLKFLSGQSNHISYKIDGIQSLLKKRPNSVPLKIIPKTMSLEKRFCELL